MIEVKNITVRYGGVTALDAVSLTIPDGKIVSIVGANGSGKSTSINAISRMVDLAKGEIFFDGQRLNVPPHEIVKRGIVQVPEERKIFSSITVKGNLILGAYMIRDKKRVEQNAQMALSIADYAYVLETGRMVSEGEGKKIADDPIVDVIVGTSTEDTPPAHRDFAGFRIMAGNTRKHLRALSFTPRGREVIIEMAKVLSGGKSLKENPIYNLQGENTMGCLAYLVFA